MLLLPLLLVAINSVTCELRLSTNLITLTVGDKATFQLRIIQSHNVSNITLRFTPEHDNIIEVSPTTVLVGSSNTTNSTYNITVVAIEAGKSGIVITKDPPDAIDKAPLFLLVHIYNSKALLWLAKIVGWLYCLSWSLYYYPQIYTNYKRGSVVGLNFDHLMFGVFGYTMYSIFNSGLFFIPSIKEQFSQRYPRSIIPVEPNDVVTSLHNLLAYCFTSFQCFIYEKGDQTISMLAKMAIGFYSTLLIAHVFLAYQNLLIWLDVLYFCSYLKLFLNVTFLMPQIRMNYKRKSTKGWNIWGSMLSIAGGFLGILQMLLNGYNYANWKNVVENPAKFGIGIISMATHSIFMVQHFVLYPEK